MEHLAGKSAGELLDYCGLTRQDILILDDPPGMLRGFAFKRDEGTESKWYTIILESSAAFHSPTRDWSFEAIREATVLQIFEGSRLF